MQKIFLGITALVAVLSLTLVLFWSAIFAPTLRPPKPEKHMEELVPMQAGKWHGEFRPLANTEEVLRATEAILAVTEFLSRSYKTADGREFTLYISYWAQGKEPTVRAASHIPDNCWVLNGWQIMDGTKKFGEEIALDGKTLMPVYERTFLFQEKGLVSERIYKRNVRYWFIIEGETYNYGEGDLAIPSPIKYVENMLAESRKGIPEQYFIRIDSEEPMETLFADGDFQIILKSLGELVLYKKNVSALTNSEL